MNKTDCKQKVNKYIAGFVLSITLTVIAYWLAVGQPIHGWALRLVITALAMAQLIVQLHFFVHLDSESKPRFKLTIFAYTILSVVVLVVGSIWIMYNLDYSHKNHEMKSETEVDSEIIQDEGIH